MGNRPSLVVSHLNISTRLMLQKTAVFIIMAVDAEVFPITSVRRIVAMIVVFVVHRKKVEVFDGKLSTTAGAHPGVDPQ